MWDPWGSEGEGSGVRAWALKAERVRVRAEVKPRRATGKMGRAGDVKQRKLKQPQAGLVRAGRVWEKRDGGEERAGWAGQQARAVARLRA